VLHPQKGRQFEGKLKDGENLDETEGERAKTAGRDLKFGFKRMQLHQ